MTKKTHVRNYDVDLKQGLNVICKNSPSRVSLTISNNSAAKIYLAAGPAGTAGRGLPLVPDGAVSFTRIEDFAAVESEYTVFQNQAGGTVNVLEVLETFEADQ